MSIVVMLILFLNLSFFVKSNERNRATHVRTEDKVEAIQFSLEEFMKDKNATNFEKYQNLSNYPIWEDTNDSQLIEIDPIEDEQTSLKKGFKDLTKNITEAYSELIQSKMRREFDMDEENSPDSFSNYLSEFPVNSANNEQVLLDRLNKTKNAIALGKNITVIKEDDREMLRKAFPEDFVQDYDNNTNFTNVLTANEVDDLLRQTRINHQKEHERIEQYLQGFNVTSPTIKSKIGDLYDSYVLLSVSAQEYSNMNNNTYENKTKTPFSIPLKPYHIWEGIDKLWNIHMSKTTTPNPKTRDSLNKIDEYNSFIRWQREEPFRVYDAFYDAIKERKENRDILRREYIKQRDRVLEERMRKQRAVYAPAKDIFDDVGNATEMLAGHVDNRFGQLFDEVAILMDKESKEREKKYYDITFKNKMDEFCLVYPECCVDMSQCPEFVYNFIKKARILF